MRDFIGRTKYCKENITLFPSSKFSNLRMEFCIKLFSRNENNYKKIQNYFKKTLLINKMNSNINNIKKPSNNQTQIFLSEGLS